MAPEQMRSAKTVDARADIWSLGAVLYKLLTGRTPFEALSYPDLVLKVTGDDPPPPPGSFRKELPQPLEAAILRCLEKNPSARFADVAELASALAPFGTAPARESAQRAARTLTVRAERPREGGAQGAAVSVRRSKLPTQTNG
jgi:serine/threonine-protein kinase